MLDFVLDCAGKAGRSAFGAPRTGEPRGQSGGARTALETSWLLLGLALWNGCASRPVDPATGQVWPAPPETARIAFVQSVTRPGDLGIKVSPFTRIGHWLTGSDKGNEPLIKPFGIGLDEQDNLCLTDTGAKAVCFYDRSRKKWQRWDHVGSVGFVAPVAVARRQGTFFVADTGLRSVLAFQDDARLLRRITNHLERPAGLAVLPDQLLVADSQRHCIVTFDFEGNYLREFGRRGLGPGEFNYPTHLAADPQGRLLVTDSMNHRVQLLDAQGNFKAQIGQLGDSPGRFSRPKGVAADPSGHVYVVDALFDNLQIFDGEGRFLLNLGEAGSGPGQFWLPNGIAISRAHEIYVTDSYNRRVQIFKYVGPT